MGEKQCAHIFIDARGRRWVGVAQKLKLSLIKSVHSGIAELFSEFSSQNGVHRSTNALGARQFTVLFGNFVFLEQSKNAS
jgi:hypothetical protein